MEPRDLKSCGCGKQRGGLRAPAEPLMSAAPWGICCQALMPTQAGVWWKAKSWPRGKVGKLSTPTTTYSVPTVATTPLCPGGGWGQCSKVVGPLNHSYPYPFPRQSERNERSCGAEGSCDKWLQSGSALVSQVRTEQPWPIGAPPAGCGDSAWLPSSHPASPEGRAWLTITQIITS